MTWFVVGPPDGSEKSEDSWRPAREGGELLGPIRPPIRLFGVGLGRPGRSAWARWFDIRPSDGGQFPGAPAQFDRGRRRPYSWTMWEYLWEVAEPGEISTPGPRPVSKSGQVQPFASRTRFKRRATQIHFLAGPRPVPRRRPAARTITRRGGQPTEMLQYDHERLRPRKKHPLPARCGENGPFMRRQRGF